ncbi:DNA methylase [Kitasatospora griseola]|uniref:DNA methylase n=1 Tax=Kitasatospora griseola TaxID=2064 RepID=UPI0036D9A2C9
MLLRRRCRHGLPLGRLDVVDVDIDSQPNYPFKFVRADAVEYAAANADRFDLVHASPPCQTHSTLTKGTNKGRTYPDLVSPLRDTLTAAGVPFVLENVQGSPLRRDLTLCGEMFDLGVIRHRYFELHGFTVAAPAHRPHRGRVAGMRHGKWYDGPYFAAYGEGGGKGTVPQWQNAMGIHWTSIRREIAEAIPPAYTAHIARAFLDARTEAAALLD